MSAMVVFGESRCLGQMSGKHNVLHSDLTRQELLHRHTRPSRETETATRYWEMLPPGSYDNNISNNNNYDSVDGAVVTA